MTRIVLIAFALLLGSSIAEAQQATDFEGCGPCAVRQHSDRAIPPAIHQKTPQLARCVAWAWGQ